MNGFTQFAAVLLATLWVGLPTQANCSMIRAHRWERLVDDADFVGIIECIDAGGIVARYRVEDSWKGMPSGTEFLLRITPDPQGDQFPISLFGERLLVTAFKRAPLANFVSFSSGSWCPLWRRQITADFELPLFQGRASLDGGNFRWDLFRTDLKAVSIFKTWVLDFLRLPEGQRERRHLLDEVISIYQDYVDPSKQSVEAVRTKLESLRTLQEVVKEILRLAGAASDKAKSRIILTLSQAGGRMTLGVLHQMKAEAHQLDPKLVAAIEKALSDKLTLEKKPLPEEVPQTPSPDELKAAREIVAKVPWDYQVPAALRTLVIHEPKTAVEALLAWQSSDKRNPDNGYALGS
ncbi:MAG: hypothetical protein B7Z47_05820, partial [Chthoniobacter sp. 12-60-6]